MFAVIVANNCNNHIYSKDAKFWFFNKSTAVFYGLYSYRPQNDVKKCSKHEPQAGGFTAKFWTFYGVILWSIRV